MKGRLIRGYIFLFLAGIMVSTMLDRVLLALLISITAMAFFFLVFVVDWLRFGKDSGGGLDE